MLRVGLTGELGSGKSTVARLLAQRGAVVLSSDEMGRAMMQPGQPVYAWIVERFGSSIVQKDGSIDRKALAHIAFDPLHPRIEELNAIVHPAVIAEQAKQITSIAQTQPDAIVVVESALIFSTRYAPGGSWSERFDCIVLVTAPEETKLARFLDRAANGRQLSAEERLALHNDARRRLAQQRIVGVEEVERDPSKCVTLPNEGSLAELEQQVTVLWRMLTQLERDRTLSQS
ncbi:MAG TPA: dephospho-CoA kinase [Acidobacteriaceae bacterium]